MADISNNTDDSYRPSISYLIMAMTLTFGQRFVIPITGRYEVGVSLVVCTLLFAYWFFRGQIYIHATRFALYLASVVGIICCAAFNSDNPETSTVKVAYLIVIYASWIFVHHDVRGPIPFFRCYRACMTIIACIGLGQFAIQVVGIQSFDPLTLLSERIIAKGYYSHQPLTWGSQFYKSFGVFIYEPSYYSRMLAIALVMEVLFFKQAWRMVLFGAAILPAFSGTGLIILAVLYPGVLMKHPKLLGGVTLAGLLLVIPTLLLTPAGETFLGRSTEFSNSESSGNLRFVAPYTRLFNTFDTQYLIGHGPGTIDDFQNLRNVVRKRDRHLVYSFGYSYIKEVDAYSNTFVTIIYELGVFCGVPMLAYIGYCFFRRAWSFPMSIGMFLYLMVLAGDFSQVETVLLCYSLCFMTIRPVATAESPVVEIAARRRAPQPLTAFSSAAVLR